MSDMPPAVVINGPLFVPKGPLEDDTKDAIIKAVSANVPSDKHLVVMALLDKDGAAQPEAKFGAAWRIDEHWQLASEVDAHWGGEKSGYVGIVGVF